MENLNPLMSFNNNNNWESNNNLQTLLLSSSSSTSTSNYNYLFPNNFQQTIIPNTSFLGQTHDNNNHDHEKREEEEEDHDDDDDDEELGAMKEMMYKMAAMQPVEVDPATVRRPRRRNVRISDDPQSVAARHRRERISERIRILQRLVPGGTKLDTASMLHEAIRYLKFLKRQIKLLQNPINNNNSVSSSSSSSFSDYHHSAIHSTSNSNLSFVSSHYHHHNHHRLGLVGGSFNASLSTSSSSSLPQSTSGTGIFDDHHFWPVLNYNHYSTN